MVSSFGDLWEIDLIFFSEETNSPLFHWFVCCRICHDPWQLLKWYQKVQRWPSFTRWSYTVRTGHISKLGTFSVCLIGKPQQAFGLHTGCPFFFFHNPERTREKEISESGEWGSEGRLFRIDVLRSQVRACCWYRKVVYKSPGLCAIFQLFWCGFYSSAAFIWGQLICKIPSP